MQSDSLCSLDSNISLDSPSTSCYWKALRTARDRINGTLNSHELMQTSLVDNAVKFLRNRTNQARMAEPHQLRCDQNQAQRACILPYLRTGHTVRGHIHHM